MKLFNLRYIIIIVVFVIAILSILLLIRLFTNLKKIDENAEMISEKDTYSRFAINGPEKYGFSVYFSHDEWRAYVLEGHIELINSTDSTIMITYIETRDDPFNFNCGYECCLLKNIKIPPKSSFIFRYIANTERVFGIKEDEIPTLKDMHLLVEDSFLMAVRGKIYDNDYASEFSEFFETFPVKFTFDTKELRCLIIPRSHRRRL